MSKTLGRAELEPLLLGGCFFGSGGGGTIESAGGLVQHFEKRGLLLRGSSAGCDGGRGH